MGGGQEEGESLEFTPTWVVAVVCTVIVAISLFVERLLHWAGKYLKKNNQKPLYQALHKIKAELMVLGFISLLLTVFQGRITKMCIPKNLALHWLPCKKPTSEEEEATIHFSTFFHSLPGTRHLLATEPATTKGYCEAKDKVPLLSLTALHHLDIFIFVLAVSHVVCCALTILFGSAKIRQWKRWEDAIQKEENDPEQALDKKLTPVQEHDFIRGRFLGFGKSSGFLGWLHSFFKQFSGSITKADYTTLRLGFIMTHCPGNPKFNFHKYMTRAFEADLKRVVGISWYLWIFVVLFLLLNVHGWHAYFWIAFIPLGLLVGVGAKLEHIITEVANEVAEKHAAVEGELVVKPSDHHFWFSRPRLVLLLIHVILFQNAFEIAVFFWALVQFKIDSCFMGKFSFVIPRLVIGAFVQFVCSYSTLPLYAIVTQMGSKIKMVAFDAPIQQGLVGWAQKARKNKLGHLRKAVIGSSTQVGPKESLPLTVLQMAQVGDRQVSPTKELEKAEEVHEANATVSDHKPH